MGSSAIVRPMNLLNLGGPNGLVSTSASISSVGTKVIEMIALDLLAHKVVGQIAMLAGLMVNRVGVHCDGALSVSKKVN
jgi:hypothetical protein